MTDWLPRLPQKLPQFCMCTVMEPSEEPQWLQLELNQLHMHRMAAKGADLAPSGSWVACALTDGSLILQILAPGGAIMAYSSVWDRWSSNGSRTWARLITEQWLLFWSQTGSFSFICVGQSVHPSIRSFTLNSFKSFGSNQIPRKGPMCHE